MHRLGTYCVVNCFQKLSKSSANEFTRFAEMQPILCKSLVSLQTQTTKLTSIQIADLL